MKKYALTLTLLGITSILLGQNLPTSHVDSAGNLYWRKSAPVYLFISDNPDGAQHRMKSKVTCQYADPFYLDTEGINYLRSRNAVDPETKKVLPDTEVLFEIYADGLTPTSEISYTTEGKFVDGETVYYRSGLRIDLSSKDQMSGVRKLHYAINKDTYSLYDNPLTFDNAGPYQLNYFAEDNVGNVEEVQTIDFIIDGQAPNAVINITGITEDKVISTGSKIYLTVVDDRSGVKFVKYKFDDGSFRTYRGKGVDFTDLEEGEHTIYFFAEDKVGNVQATESYDFYFDKSAPLMVADVLGDRFVVDEEVYFSGRTKLKLTAVDNKVGVKAIMYSIDNQEFEEYQEPFYLPSVSGNHSIRYYSVDNLNNSTAQSSSTASINTDQYEEFKHNVSKVYVDLNGPVISHKIENYFYKREDTLYIGPYSKIKFIGEDAESGLRNFTYAINDEPGETAYTEPFTLSEEGFTTLNYYGYDNVNNRNVSKELFYVDATPPEISVLFNTGSTRERSGLSEYPLTAGIFLSATDKTSGVQNLYYTLDKNKEKAYAGLINNLSKGKHTLIVRAVDLLNNEKTTEIQFYIK